MVSYKLEWKRSVSNDLRKIDKKQVPRILEAIDSLKNNPRPVDCRKLLETERTYRVRVGDYRIIYQVNDREKSVLVEYIRHRKDAYKAR